VRAITVSEPGGPDALVWSEVPDPQPAVDGVVVDVVATAVNRADVLQRQGRYPPPPGAPPYLGLECAGTVRSVGPEVSGWSVGDQVCALLAGGGYAEQVAVPAGQLLPAPVGLDLVTAATLPEVACTVWSNLVMVARIQAGQTVLLHGGASGVGTMAIQVARELGARVAVTAGTASKLERCKALGAEIAINYREEDFVAALREQTDGRGADVILDIVGGPYLGRNVDALAPEGTLVVIGLQGGLRGELNLGALLTKGARVVGTTLRARSAEQKAEIVAEVAWNLWPLVEQQRVRPVVDRVLPLTEAAEAHRALEAGEHVGKIALAVPGQR
jgi:putative PIG3 family NAD(P)H quinone oxidoreductase